MKTRSSAKKTTQQPVPASRGKVPRTITSGLLPFPLSNYSTNRPRCLLSPAPKRSLDSQEDTHESKRRRTARKSSRPATSEAEGPSSSSSSALFDEESELVALRKTLQQVQEDLSALQQDQRQLDDITRGIQHDLDEAQPRDMLRFLEEHFTCAL